VLRLPVGSARAYQAAFLTATLLAVPAIGRTAPVDAGAATVRTSNIRIDNFGEVSPAYYRGGQPKDRDYGDLASLGVKTVINLTSDDADASEKAMAAGAGLKYFQIPMTTHRVPTAGQLAEFLRIVGDAANQPVYVHCVGGRHRTGVMTAIYRITHDGWDAARAFAEMKHYGFGADFLHSEFKDFVFGYRADAAQLATAAHVKAGS